MRKTVSFLLTFSVALLLFSCKNNSEELYQDNFQLSFKQDSKVLSLGEKIPVRDLLVEAENKEFDPSKVKLKSDKSIVTFNDGVITAKQRGEAIITLTSKGKTHTLNLWIQDFKKGVKCTDEQFKRYIWDFTKDPKTPLNKTERPVVIDFWSVQCGACRLLEPSYDLLAEEYRGRAILLKVNLTDPKGSNWHIPEGLYDSEHPTFSKLFNGKAFPLPTFVGLSAKSPDQHMAVSDATLYNVKNFLKSQF